MSRKNNQAITTPEYLIALAIIPIPLYALIGSLYPMFLNEQQIAIIYFLLGLLGAGVLMVSVIRLFMNDHQKKLLLVAAIISVLAAPMCLMLARQLF